MHESAQQPTVAFVSMPFHVCNGPAMGVSLLKAVLAEAGIPSTIYNFNLDLVKYLVEDPPHASRADCNFVDIPAPFSGDWVFRPRESPEVERESEARFASTLQPGEAIARLLRLRPNVAAFVEECKEKLVRGNHDILCFTSSFMQTRASLCVAEAVKSVLPETRVVLGGANAFGEMGRALLEAFPVLDVVCHGEGELVIEPVIRAVRAEAGHSLHAIRGISFRQDGALVLGSGDGESPLLDRIPLPDFQDFLRQSRQLQDAGQLPAGLPVQLPFETSRGCWWGEKHHCAFCSQNAERLTFRSKSPERVLDELESQAEACGIRSFCAADNVLPQDYFHTVLKTLAERGKPYELFWEIRPNLTREQVETLARAGVQSAQPGIESLSTPLLQSMSKGVTAIENIQTLKWLTEFRIETFWNHLNHVPGEKLEWLQEIAGLLPRVMHLQPPQDSRIVVERFAPYYTRAEEFGIVPGGPTLQCRLAFPDVPPEILERLTYILEYSVPERDPALDAYFESVLHPLLEQWRQQFAAHGCTLSILHGPEESLLVHGSIKAPKRLTRVRGRLRQVLLACERTRLVETLAALIRGDRVESTGLRLLDATAYSELVAGLSFNLESPRLLELSEDLDRILDGASGAGLIMREGAKVLSLPVNQTDYSQTAVYQRSMALRRLKDLFFSR